MINEALKQYINREDAKAGRHPGVTQGEELIQGTADERG
jgi:hypothetical protein